MPNYANIKASIASIIRENGNNEITGALLQQCLLAMINSLGADYQFVGIATPTTNPGTPDQNVAYVAGLAGTYANFGGVTLADGEFAVLKYNGAWAKETGFNFRSKYPYSYYPFAELNDDTRKYGPAIVEVYINGEKYQTDDFRIRTFRYQQTGLDWEGERTEFVLADEYGDILNYLTFDTPPYYKFVHNEDYSVCAFINFGAIEPGTGYGANFVSSLNKKIVNAVKVAENSPTIALLKGVEESINVIEKSEIRQDVTLTWERYGIDSAGGLNTFAEQMHTTITDVIPGTVFEFERGIYRVNLFLDGEFVKQDSDFLPPGPVGVREYSSPTDAVYNTVMVSCYGNYLVDTNNVRLILNVTEILKAVSYALKAKQDLINGNIDEWIDYAGLVQNGSISGATGLLVPYTYYRSIVGLPLRNDKNIIILNPVDRLSNKQVSFWDANDTLTRIVNVVDMTNYKLEHTETEVRANITLISGLAPYPDRLREISVCVTADDRAKISEINGIPLDIPQIPSGVLTGIKAAGTLLPKDVNTVDIPNASPTQSGLLTPENLQKLSLITPGNITISGSGVTKNASAFGFLPNKTASENVAALRDAVAGGGTILVDYPGTYLVDDTILIGSNTDLIFGAGVFISMQADKRFLLNAGAENRTYDENIRIVGLNLISNQHNVISTIYGLRGYIAFFYVRNLYISGFSLLDGGSNPFVIHVCTFENVLIENVRIEGLKDAIHFGRGKGFVVRNGLFKTHDDPIALNAHDYPTSNPEFGDIVDGTIENCTDLSDISTVGYFARLLPGAWVDWFSGMEVHSFGDTVVSEGRIYTTSGTMGDTIISTVKPTFASGQETLSDGVTWTMQQDSGVVYSATCRNIIFRNIHLQKERSTAFSAFLDNSQYSRSYYPNAVVPVLRNIVFENIYIEANVSYILSGPAPIDIIRVLNSDISKMDFGYMPVTGLVYPQTTLIMVGTAFRGTGTVAVLTGNQNRIVNVKIIGSSVDGGLTPTATGVNVITNDIGL